MNTKHLCIEKEIKRNKMAMGWSCAEKRDANLTKVPSKWKQNCKRTREKKAYSGMSRRMGKYQIKEIGKT